MRKVLFRVLIVVLVTLLFVLGIAFYKDKTPLAVLQNWFHVEPQTVIIQEKQTATPVKQDSQDQIKDIVAQETWENTDDPTMTINGSESTKSTNNGALSEKEKQETKQLIDSLFTK